jgi:hypothetical protein
MRTIHLKHIIVFSISAALILIACGKKEAATYMINKIEAKVENGDSHNSQIDTVKALIETGNHIIASSAYLNGSFSICLPDTIDNNLLAPIFDKDNEDISNLNISNMEIMGATLKLTGYKSEAAIGDFEYKVPEHIQAYYYYVNGDVNLTGKQDVFETEIRYNISLKKGWNIIYMQKIAITENERSIVEIINSIPTQSNLKWYLNITD